MMSTIWLETCRGIRNDIINKCIRLETRNQSNITQFIYFWRTALHVSGGIFTIIRSKYNCIYSIWYLLTVRDKNKLLIIFYKKTYKITSNLFLFLTVNKNQIL